MTIQRDSVLSWLNPENSYCNTSRETKIERFFLMLKELHNISIRKANVAITGDF